MERGGFPLCESRGALWIDPSALFLSWAATMRFQYDGTPIRGRDDETPQSVSIFLIPHHSPFPVFIPLVGRL